MNLQSTKPIMLKRIFLLAVAINFSAAGCASNSVQSPRPSLLYEQRTISEITQAVQKQGGNISRLHFLEIASPSNAISAGIMVSMLKSGNSSKGVDALESMFRKSSDIQAAVFGTNDAVIAATVENALERNSSMSQTDSILWIFLNNPSDYREALRSAAQRKGMRLEVLLASFNRGSADLSTRHDDHQHE